MAKKNNYLKKSLSGGLRLTFRHFLYIAVYWAVVTLIFFLLISPFSAAVNETSGTSDISADAAKNSDISGYFLIDLLPALSPRVSAALNPHILILGGLLAFAVGAFFNGAFLESFKRRLSSTSSRKSLSKHPEDGRIGDFVHGGTRNFLTMAMFFLLGAVIFLLLNTLASSSGWFLKAFVWGTTESESAAYYTGLAVRIIYYILFIYLVVFLQYARIAVVFGDEIPKDVRLRSVMKFKDGLWQGYDFLSDNILKATSLFLIILAMTAVWFVLDHLVFFNITENGSFDPLLWSAFTGLGYIFFRILQYASAAIFLKSH